MTTSPDLPACSDREAFEAWAKKHAPWIDLSAYPSDGAYIFGDTCNCLEAWTAALAHARQTPDPSAARIAELEGALRKARPYVEEAYEMHKRIKKFWTVSTPPSPPRQPHPARRAMNDKHTIRVKEILQASGLELAFFTADITVNIIPESGDGWREPREPGSYEVTDVKQVDGPFIEPTKLAMWADLWVDSSNSVISRDRSEQEPF